MTKRERPRLEKASRPRTACFYSQKLTIHFFAVIVENNLDVIKTAEWVIEPGSERSQLRKQSMDIQNTEGISLRNLAKNNVIIGKNGCGKSHILKSAEKLIDKENFGLVRYVSPERGGQLNYLAHVDQNINSHPNWISESRRQNQSDNFRQQSMTLFRRLELMVLRFIENNQTKPNYNPITFDTTVEIINTLLDRVRIERDNKNGFKILLKSGNSEIKSDSLSSGEAELISLGIEFLTFAYEADENKDNVIFIDEPDVHLHPDLQYKLAKFIVYAFKEKPIYTIMATHSTAIIAGLSSDHSARIAFMRQGDFCLDFRDISVVDKAILPIFGAHPLSNAFNESPILLVEGDDDARCWQQAVRSSNGKLRIYPCPVGDVQSLTAYETQVSSIAAAIYDSPKAFSIRDGDGISDALEPVGCVERFRLNCRAAENLLLTNDVLLQANTDWIQVQSRIADWIERNSNHQYFAEVQDFQAQDFERRNFNLKNIRNILASLITTKPWEFLVGQTIGNLQKATATRQEGSLIDFLGNELVDRLMP